MRVAEIYVSRQGEGFLTGTESLFVRTSGCNLRCWFCDTPFTSWAPEGDDLAVEEILSAADRQPIEHVVITGGEPMLFAELAPLCEGLKVRGRHVTIETAGTLHLPVHCDLMSISPKLRGSAPPAARDGRWAVRHERSRHAPGVIRRLLAEFPYQLKFVIDRPEDVTAALAWLDEFPTADRRRVLLMPQGVTPEELVERAVWLEPMCAELGFSYCPRKHIEWYGHRRGT